MTAAIQWGRFTDPAVERAFREQSWPEWSTRVRVVALVGAGLMACFAYTDWLALGPVPELYSVWLLRGVLLVAAVGVARLSLGPARPDALDAATLGLLLLFAITLQAVIGLEGRSLLFQAPGAILLVLGFYLFIPTRPEAQVIASLYTSAGVLALGWLRLQSGREELAVAAGELLICNVIGAYTSLRWHGLQRREYTRRGELERHAAYQQLIARLSTRFVTAAPEQAESLILAALADVGEFTGADRAFVFEFDHEQQIANCTQEWSRSGLLPAMRTLQRVPFRDFSWAMRELLEGRPMVASKMSELPPEAALERAEAERHGARSLIVLPLLFGRRVLGAIGFHAVHREREWTEEPTALLRMAGEMIIGVLAHRRSRDQLAEQARSLEESVTALEKTNADLQQFAHVASHDLQEPLRSISSFSSLLSERYAGRLDASADEYLGYLRGAANRMHELVTGLLGYSGLSRKGSVLEPLDAGGVLAEALGNLKREIADTGAEILTSTLPVVYGDRSQLVLVFQHLLDNALKFRGPLAPRIALSVQRVDGLWEFSVKDNGIGVESRHAERIFQPFARLHPPGKYAGTGISLAVCRRVIERHRGRIWVESDGARGSTFRFTVPAA